MARRLEVDIRVRAHTRSRLERYPGGRNVVVLNPRESPLEQGVTVVHELGHLLAGRAGLDDQDEELADAIGRALLFPRSAFLCDLRELGCDLEALRERHPYGSYELLGRRILDLSSSPLVMWHWEREPRGRRPVLYLSPELRWEAQRPMEIERAAMERALETRAAACFGPVRAWADASGSRLAAISLLDLDLAGDTLVRSLTSL